jgi:hypothetical protein
VTRYLLLATALGYLAGALSVVAVAVHFGPDMLIQSGFKLAAMQATYAYDGRPVDALDERQVAAFIEQAPPKKGRK